MCGSFFVNRPEEAQEVAVVQCSSRPGCVEISCLRSIVRAHLLLQQPGLFSWGPCCSRRVFSPWFPLVRCGRSSILLAEKVSYFYGAALTQNRRNFVIFFFSGKYVLCRTPRLAVWLCSHNVYQVLRSCSSLKISFFCSTLEVRSVMKNCIGHVLTLF